MARGGGFGAEMTETKEIELEGGGERANGQSRKAKCWLAKARRRQESAKKEMMGGDSRFRHGLAGTRPEERDSERMAGGWDRPRDHFTVSSPPGVGKSEIGRASG